MDRVSVRLSSLVGMMEQEISQEAVEAIKAKILDLQTSGGLKKRGSKGLAKRASNGANKKRQSEVGLR